MWKTIVLCASLFASAALGLVTAARWAEPAALPAAIGLCVVGVILILIAPGREAVEAPLLRPAFSHSSSRLKAIEEKTVTRLSAGPQPSLH